MTSILFVIIGLALLILVHEWGHFLAARFFDLLVEEFGIGFPPRLFARKVGETLYSFNLIPLGGFVKIYGENINVLDHVKKPSRSFAYQKAWKRAVVIVAGVFMNFLFGWLVISSIFFVGSPSVVLVEEVMADSPASAAGILMGDQIIDYEKAEDLVKMIAGNKGKEMTLNVKRKEKELQIQLVPRVDPPQGEGALGITLRDGGIPKQGILASVGKGFVASIVIIGAVFAGLYQAVFSPENIIGPVGIFDIAINIGNLGVIYLFQFLALISLNLVVLNILPIPALDGGRLLFIIIEKIRGKKLSPKLEMKANAFGFIFLIGLIVLITLKDIAGFF